MKFKGLLIIIAGALGYIGCAITVEAVQEQRKLRAKEGECIAYYIKLGIPRKNIVTSSGTCHIIGQ